MNEVPIDEYIGAYINIKTELEAKKREFKEFETDLKSQMEKMHDVIFQYAKDAGLEKITCKSGTAYQITKQHVSVTNWDQFFDFIAKNELSEMITKSPKKESVREYIEEFGELPPGINLTSEITMNIRRSK